MTGAATQRAVGVDSARTIRVVLPAYNEEASLGDLLDRLAGVLRGAGMPFAVTVVDDGSLDRTGEIAAEAAARMPVEVLRNKPNRGLGYTIRRGLRAATEAAGPDDVIVTLDADLTQDPAYIPGMIATLDERDVDVVIASRYQRGSGVEGLSTIRRILSYGASAVVALARPIHDVRDYSCGFRVYRAAILKRAFAEFGDGFITETGFACMLEIAERLRPIARFAEVPFVLHYQEKRKASTIRIMPTVCAYFRVIAKVARTGRRSVPGVTLGLAFTSVLLGAAGQVFLRMGAHDLGGMQARALLMQAAHRPQILVGVGLYALSSIIWLGVLSRMELSVAYPLGASGYVFVAILAAINGEHIPFVRWIGVLVIVLGVMVVGWLGVAPTVTRERS